MEYFILIFGIFLPWLLLKLIPNIKVSKPNTEVQNQKPESETEVEADSVTELVAELDSQYEELRSWNEELMSKNEALEYHCADLICRNEELDSQNDELMSQNEELTSRNEELRSWNEELKNWNKEITSQNEELISWNKDLKSQNEELRSKEKELKDLKEDLKNITGSNVAAMPWLAGMMADFLTYEFELKAKALDWGADQKRLKKVESIRELRLQAAEITKCGKEAIYQLEYLRQLFPELDDYMEADYKDIFSEADSSISASAEGMDPTRKWLSKEEWDSLCDSERNQLALDRYVASRKTKWQIGRDYELSVAWEYQKAGYDVDTVGSYMKLDDHGRDLIAKRGTETIIVQCKYWSSQKTIHENHVFQLFGSVVSYCLENKVGLGSVSGVLVTNIGLSDFARRVAYYLGIVIVENHAFAEFPRIKCNINHTEYGVETKIYHLPMDKMYDLTKINKNGEFYAYTVAEAEEAGFRRAYRWSGA